MPDWFQSSCYHSVAQLYPTLGNPMHCSMPGFPVLHYFLELAQTHAHWIRDTIQPSHLLFSFLHVPSIFSSIRVFSNKLALHIRWSNYWSFSFSIGPSKEYSGLIFFRNDWFDSLAVQGTLKSFLQHHSSKASILRHLVGVSPTLTSIHDYWKNQSFDLDGPLLAR